MAMNPDNPKPTQSRQQQARQAKVKQLINDLRPVLIDGEKLIDITNGLATVTRGKSKTERRGTIALTDRRVLIFTKKLGGHDLSDFAYGLITGVEHKRGLLFGELTIRASGDAGHIKQIPKEDVMRVAQRIRDKIAVTKSSQTSDANADGGHAAEMQNLEQLEKLADLQKKGVITKEEFAAKKKQLLGL
jgi:hypothetical protein